MKRYLRILLLLLLFGCDEKCLDDYPDKREYSNAVKSDQIDTLILVSHERPFKFAMSGALIDTQNDTIIPYGVYEKVEKDTFFNFAVLKGKDGIFGVDKRGEIIFDIYTEGDFIMEDMNKELFRVERNGKVGFANQNGEVLIPCQYHCAEGFKNGKARVSCDCYIRKNQSGDYVRDCEDWFYIDNSGNKIE